MQYKFEESFESETLVLSLDFDGCTDNELSQKILINWVIKLCKSHNYKNIYIAIGSLRQSILTDINNAIKNSKAHDGKLCSCSVLLKKFLTDLRQCLEKELDTPPKINSINLLMHDIFNDLPEGTTLNLMNQDEYEKYRKKALISKPSTLIHKSSTLISKPSISIQDGYSRNISDLNDDDFEDWYDNNIRCLNENEKVKFLYDLGVTVDEFDEYVSYRTELEPEPKPEPITFLEATNKLNQKISMLDYSWDSDYFTCINNLHFDDSSKCLTLYVLCQYMSNKIKEKYDILHFDDRVDLLDGINSFFVNNSSLIPKNCSYAGVNWISRFPFLIENYEIKYIKGIGETNTKYAEKAKEIAKLCIENNYDVKGALKKTCSAEIKRPKPIRPPVFFKKYIDESTTNSPENTENDENINLIPMAKVKIN